MDESNGSIVLYIAFLAVALRMKRERKMRDGKKGRWRLRGRVKWELINRERKRINGGIAMEEWKEHFMLLGGMER